VLHMSDTLEQTKKDNLCPAAREDPEGCPYGGPSRSNCTDCQDLPIWWFDKDNSLAETKTGGEMNETM